MVQATATATLASAVMFSKHEQRRKFQAGGFMPTPEDVEVAAAALAWAREHFGSMDPETSSEFDHNMFVATKGETLVPKAMGMAAYAVQAYLSFKQKELEAKLAAENGKASEHFGEVGVRMDFYAVVLKMRRSESEQWGTSYGYTLRTREGNDVIWWTSSRPTDAEGMGIEPSDKEFLVTGTVKAHSVFNNVKQTAMSRCVLFTDEARVAQEAKIAKKAAAAAKKAEKAAKAAK